MSSYRSPAQHPRALVVDTRWGDEHPQNAPQSHDTELKQPPYKRPPPMGAKPKVGKSRHQRSVKVKGPPRSTRTHRSITQRFGDMTLRDAADMTATVLKGGIRLATRLLNVEEKIADVGAAAFTLTSAGYVDNLSGMAEGLDWYQRTGNSIGARNLRFSFTLTANAAVSPAPSYTRLILVQDLECNGTAPTLALVLEAATMNSAFNHVTGNRFRVFVDEVFAPVSGNHAVTRKYACPIDTDILYQGTTAGVASQYNGNIFLLAFSDAAVNGPSFAYSSRLTYVDN